jgi:hypothetical protein
MGETMLNSTTNIRLTYAQCDQVVVQHLQEFHFDLKESLLFELDIEDHLDILKSIMAIETIMKDFLTDEEYISWKTEYGVDLLK